MPIKLSSSCTYANIFFQFLSHLAKEKNKYKVSMSVQHISKRFVQKAASEFTGFSRSKQNFFIFFSQKGR
jgi:hypothetical protein